MNKGTEQLSLTGEALIESTSLFLAVETPIYVKK
jgi:hypothetical protein